MSTTIRYALRGQLLGIAASITLSALLALAAFTLIPDSTAATLTWFFPSITAAALLPGLGYVIGSGIGLRKEFPRTAGPHRWNA